MRVVTEIEHRSEFHGGVFVPTMGALHEGHLSLIRRAAEIGRPVVVSVFVNPSQFGPGEDFQKYPRTLERDMELAAAAGADVVFAPAVETVYPPSEKVAVPELPAVATEPGLEDRFRPRHFAGVCQVVARLFDLVKPRAALFGEKDYQQLLVIRGMAERVQKNEPQRWPGLEIIGCETIREPDGLAMSSRNAYLDDAMRERGLGLSKALFAAREVVRNQQKVTVVEVESMMHETLAACGLAIDYAVVRDAATLLPIDRFNRPARALIAARVDHVRLIDNIALEPQSATAHPEG